METVIDRHVGMFWDYLGGSRKVKWTKKEEYMLDKIQNGWLPAEGKFIFPDVYIELETLYKEEHRLAQEKRQEEVRIQRKLTRRRKARMKRNRREKQSEYSDFIYLVNGHPKVIGLNKVKAYGQRLTNKRVRRTIEDIPSGRRGYTKMYGLKDDLY